MRKETQDFIFLVILCLWAFLFGFSIGERDMEKEAIEKGFAEYNQTTGKWQWKEIVKDGK